MRILFFHRAPVAIGGGSNQYVLDILPRLRAAGHEVALVHARGKEGTFSGTGYLFDALAAPCRPSPIDRARIDAILEDFQPDILQLHRVDNYHLDEFLRKKAPVLRFVHNHEAYCSGGEMGWKFPFRPCSLPHGRTCLARHYLNGCGHANPVLNLIRYRNSAGMLEALRSADAVQTLSAEVRDNLLRNGIPAERMVQLPPPVPAPPFRSGPRPPDRRRYILHVGGLLSKKGIWIAIRTLRALPPDVDLVFAGGGGEYGKVEEHIRRRGLGKRVRIFPTLSPEEWAKLYSEAEFVIMPCMWNEPLGLGAMRANAYGKPVIAFDVRGVADWLRDGVNGVLVPWTRRNDFQGAVLRLLEDREALSRLGASARAHWEKHHRIENHLAALVTHYENCLKCRAK